MEIVMAKKSPPVPPENRSTKGPGSDPKEHQEKPDTEPDNLAEQGQQGNIRHQDAQ